jgi:hypothetical protein
MLNIELPAWAHWIAMDKDGRWWCYEAEPHRHDRGWYENEVGHSQPVNGDMAEDGDMDWRSSLIKVDSSMMNTDS